MVLHANSQGVFINSEKFSDIDSSLPNISVERVVRFLDFKNVARLGKPFEQLNCDHCHVNCDGWVWKCEICNRTMCTWCYTERTEENAKKNGSKKWIERKDSLLECFEHEKEKKFVHVLDPNNRICDECGEFISLPTWYYGKNHYDICTTCYKKRRAQFSFLRKYTVSDFDHHLRNVNEWAVVYEEPETWHVVLYNVRKSSPYYHQVALMPVDAHGRTVVYPLDETLEEILGEILSSSKPQKIQSWDDHYGSPVALSVVKRGLGLCFG